MTTVQDDLREAISGFYLIRLKKQNQKTSRLEKKQHPCLKVAGTEREGIWSTCDGWGCGEAGALKLPVSVTFTDGQHRGD